MLEREGGREGDGPRPPVFFLRAREKDLETLPRPDATLNGLFGHSCNPNNHQLGDSLLPAARVCRAERQGVGVGRGIISIETASEPLHGGMRRLAFLSPV